MNSNPDAPQATDPGLSPQSVVALLARLKTVAEAIPFVEKRGHNDHHRYSFVQAVDVVRDLRAQLLAQDIIVVPGTVPGSIAHHTETGGKSFVTTVDLTYRFTCCRTGAFVEVPWTGAGADTGGDKGLYKAYTGGLKYALLALFLLPTSDDPEHDALTAPNQAAQAPGGGVDKDADRPAAPRIPIDRAKLILEQAKAAQLVNDDDSFSPVLKAKLAEVGVTKLGALNVDQAEEVEAFIAAEVTS